MDGGTTIYPDTQQIVLPYRADVEHILQAERFEHQGAWYLAARHDITSVRLLRNLGFKAPSPALSHYDFGSQHPFESQLATMDLCTVSRRAYVLSEMGVGKSRAVAWSYDYLKGEGIVKKLLIVGPLSTLTTVWLNELFECLPCLQAVVLYGDAKRRAKLLAQDADVYIINFDGIQVLHKELWKRTDIDCIIVDECASYRNSRAERWKYLQPLVKRAQYVWGLSGSPTPNCAADAYGIAKLITPESAGHSFKSFKEKVMRQVGPFQWIEKPEATKIVYETLQPAVRFTRDQCLDLPPTTYTTITCDPGTQAIKGYKQMLDCYAAELRGREVTAANAGVRLNKLLQLSAGFAYDAHGKPIFVGGADRVRQIIEVIEASKSKVIVFANYRYIVDLLEGVLAKKYSTAKIHGEVTKSARDLIFSQFQKETNPKVLVAHSATMSHGLTLTAASTIIWASPTMSLEQYEQANARITRSGQKMNTLIVNIAATRAEELVYSRLQKKGRIQDAILELFETGTNELV
jgi:SNF2 family DNA or RNA helicase